MTADAPGGLTWDAWYAAEGRPIWSGHPNGALVAELADLEPGSALDVGCGEGADAIWLAQRGWRVTALDPARVALDRAEESARQARVAVSWVHAGLLEVVGGTGVHDLVTAHYFVLPRSDDDRAITALLAAVAPGGTLLVVHHAGFPAHAAGHGQDPDAYVGVDDIAAHLDGGWQIQVHDTRPRVGPAPSPGGHVEDVILRARRTG